MAAERSRQGDGGIGTARLETFSDGVFAIAATLLIIEVGVDERGRSLSDALLQAWPSYVAYAISFLTIGIIWVNHHTVFAQIGAVDRAFLFINIGFLMLVAFIPFPTELVAAHLREEDARAAALTYGLTLTGTALLYSALWFYAALGGRLIRADADQRIVRGISRSYLPGPWIYGGATLVALVSATTSIVLFGAIALFYVLESSVFARE
ncbi:MAG: TMEM175 family protein [Chloroflexota bacterium]|nr:TMEM175 family protein [Chloroflexota bacterium]